ncbi:hypothetical protein C8F01DRAFT_1367514 [Mycena amicta]|nr:hypothetical protein C8F01DRAFT_1367514 [Mycena amicta]
MSNLKSFCTALGTHPVPSNISKEEFEAKCEALVESFLVLPTLQENLLKFDIIFQNDHLDELISGLGFPKPAPMVYMRCEYETEEKWEKCMHEPECVKAMDAAKAWGFHDNASISSVDHIVKLESADIPQHHASHGLVGILKIPSNTTPEAFFNKVETAIDAIHANSKPKSYRCSILVQNANADAQIQGAGWPPSQSVLAVLVECQKWDEIVQMMTDPAVKTLLSAAMADFPFHVDSTVSAVDVVSKHVHRERRNSA